MAEVTSYDVLVTDRAGNGPFRHPFVSDEARDEYVAELKNEVDVVLQNVVTDEENPDNNRVYDPADGDTYEAPVTPEQAERNASDEKDAADFAAWRAERETEKAPALDQQKDASPFTHQPFSGATPAPGTVGGNLSTP